MTTKTCLRGRWSGTTRALTRNACLLLGLFVYLPIGVGAWRASTAWAQGPVAETPQFAVGDEWRFVGGRFPSVVRVVSVDSDAIVTSYQGDTRCEGCRYFRDRHLTTQRVLDAQGNPTPDMTTGLRLLDFPLRIGKEWTQEIDLLQPGAGLRPYFNRFRVEAYEEVKVKAGTFKAFRISHYQENRGPSQWRGSRTYWWSPEVKWFVKATAFGGGGGGRDVELASFTLK